MAIVIRDLQKTYKAKNSPDVPALKGVSFTLPEKGMAFILGKSGCGKSTLLNVLGGLDGFDGGDVIIGGKSMKDFTARDLDRYRNDGVGFVFQENNLLDEYTVARNVGLAIELQNGKDGGDKIAAALESVDLKDFGERKCNRLSGGQKQRVAIARAIVKTPEILLCDEPTGSLDSETGEDIFTLLKKISENTLVVVVSHDRESAEKFGDRIIELKDGAVISDGGGNAESAVKTETEGNAEGNKKHGGLPAKRALSLGARFLTARPVRLALCIVICLLTFICVGVSDTFVSYDRENVIADNVKLYETPFLSFTRNSGYIDGGEYDYGFDSQTLIFDNAEYERLKTLVKSDRLDRFYNFSTENLHYNKGRGTINEIRDKQVKTFGVGFEGILEIDEKLPFDYGFKLYGDYPENYGEVVISEYIFNWFKIKGYTPDYDNAPQDAAEISEFGDIIGKKISVTVPASESREYGSYLGRINYLNLDFTIVGVLDTNVNEKVYADIMYREKELRGDDLDKYGELKEAFDSLNKYGIHSAMFTAEGFFKEFYQPQLLELYGEDNKTAGYIKSVIAPNNGGRKTLIANARIHEKYRTEALDYNMFEHYSLNVDASSVVNNKNDIMGLMKTVFFYVALSTTVISALFVLYFTLGVVTEKKREVGILRAIGASRGDVFKIFAAENGIFAAGIILSATAFTAIADVIANAVLTKGFGVKAALLTFSIRQFGVIAAVAVLAVALGVIIPVVKMLCAKPVDIISGRK